MVRSLRLRSDIRFDRKMRIAPSARHPITSALAQDDRPDYPLFRNTRSAHQHVEPRRLSEPGADVVGVVAGLELHAGLGPDGTDFRQPHPNARVCYQSAPGEFLVTLVDRLALTTAKNPVPERKRQWGYRYEADKFGIAGFTAVESESVAPPRVRECPVHMEGIVHDFRSFGKNVNANVFEVHIVKLHVDEKLLVGDRPRPRIDPARWRPLIMSFCRFFGLGGEVHPSRLAESDFMKFITQGTTPQPTNSSSTQEQR